MLPLIYELAPVETSSDPIYLYGDSLDGPRRGQMSSVDRFPLQLAPDASAGKGFDGLEPGEVGFRGFWIASEAEDLAVQAKTAIINDSDVQNVEVQTYDGAGNTVAKWVNGTYMLADEIQVNEVRATHGAMYEYRFTLVE